MGKRPFKPKPARRIQTRQEKQEVNDDVLTFDRVVVVCMSKLKIYDLQRIELMTLREFNYRMYALEYEQLDKDMDMYKLAYVTLKLNKRNVAAEKVKLSIVSEVLTISWTMRKTLNVGRATQIWFGL